MTTQDEAFDGRTARRKRNRELVVDALLDAIESGDSLPTIRQIADAAGVSERSIFRYFGDLDELLAAAMEQGITRYRNEAHIADEGQGTLDERIDALIEARLLLWVRADAAAALVRSRAAGQPVLQAALTESRRRLRVQAARHFAGVLDGVGPDEREHALSMADVIVSYESFRLQLDAGASAAEVRARWRYGLRALLRPPSSR